MVVFGRCQCNLLTFCSWFVSLNLFIIKIIVWWEGKHSLNTLNGNNFILIVWNESTKLFLFFHLFSLCAPLFAKGKFRPAKFSNYKNHEKQVFLKSPNFKNLPTYFVVKFKQKSTMPSASSEMQTSVITSWNEEETFETFWHATNEPNN